MIFLRQSTASQEIQLGKFVDDTDFKTAKTALSIANTDVKLWKEGATSQASKNSGGATHIANGWYYVVLDATDTGTIGNLIITVDVSGALSVMCRCVVLAANVYDVLFGTVAPSTHTAAAVQALVAAGAVASVTGNVGGNVVGSVASVTGAVGSVTAGVAVASIANNAITAASIATNAIDADALATDAVTEIQSGLATSAALATVSTAVVTTIPGTLATIAGYIDTEVAAIQTAVVTTIPGLLATIAGYVDTEVAAIKVVTDKLGTAMEVDGGVYRFTANALELAPTGGGDGGYTPEEIAEAVRAELQNELGRIDTNISTRFNGTMRDTELCIAYGTVTSSTSTQTFVTFDKISEGGLANAVITITSAGNAIRPGQPRLIADAQVQGDSGVLVISPPWEFTPQAGDEIAIWVFGPTNINTINGTTFTGSAIPANVLRIVGAQLTGDGTSGNPWGPA